MATWLCLGQMVENYVRLSDPSARTEEDEAHLATLEALGIKLFEKEQGAPS